MYTGTLIPLFQIHKTLLNNSSVADIQVSCGKQFKTVHVTEATEK